MTRQKDGYKDSHVIKQTWKNVNCEIWAEETRIFTVEFSTLIRLKVFTIKRWTKRLWFTHVPHIWMSLNTRPCSSVGKESACSAGDLGSIPGSGRSPGEENGNPLQYPCLENHMDWGARWAAVQGVAKSRTRLSDFTNTLMTFDSHKHSSRVSVFYRGNQGLFILFHRDRSYPLLGVTITVYNTVINKVNSN